MFGRRAPAGAGRVQQDGPPALRAQGQGVPAVGAGGRVQQVHLVQIGPQGAQAGRGGFITQHKTRGPGELGQKSRFAAGAGAHIQHGRARRGVQRQGRQHGRAILDVDVAEKSRQRAPQRARFGQQATAEGRKGLRRKNIALGAQQRLHQGRGRRGTDQTKGSGGIAHGAHTRDTRRRTQAGVLRAEASAGIVPGCGLPALSGPAAPFAARAPCRARPCPRSVE